MAEFLDVFGLGIRGWGGMDVDGWVDGWVGSRLAAVEDGRLIDVCI